MDDQMQALYLHKLNQEKAGKLGKGRKADRAPCLAVERKALPSSMKTWNWLESYQISSFVKMSNKQQRGKLTEITRQEAEDKRILCC